MNLSRPNQAHAARALAGGLLLLFTTQVWFSGCAARRHSWSGEEFGLASWYGPGYHGKRAADGSRYNQRKLTAAHRVLPLGTVVRVTNLENGREVQVKITDRGPFVAGRVIDLSRKAAKKLDMIDRGVVQVRVEVLRWGDGAWGQGN
jgi:rare lipoprotein A